MSGRATAARRRRKSCVRARTAPSTAPSRTCRRSSPTPWPAGFAPVRCSRTRAPAARPSLVASAFASRAAIVVADVFEKPDLVPLWFGDDLELLRPRFREDLGIVDGDRVRQRCLALPANALDRVKGVAVHPE